MLDEVYQKILEVAEMADEQGTELAKNEQKTEKLDQHLDKTLSKIEDRISEIRKLVKE